MKDLLGITGNAPTHLQNLWMETSQGLPGTEGRKPILHAQPVRSSMVET